MGARDASFQKTDDFVKMMYPLCRVLAFTEGYLGKQKLLVNVEKDTVLTN